MILNTSIICHLAAVEAEFPLYGTIKNYSISILFYSKNKAINCKPVVHSNICHQQFALTGKFFFFYVVVDEF